MLLKLVKTTMAFEKILPLLKSWVKLSLNPKVVQAVNGFQDSSLESAHQASDGDQENNIQIPNLRANPCVFKYSMNNLTKYFKYLKCI